MNSWIKRLVNVEAEEVQGLFWSFLYFFSLLCSYYIIRPMRDEMGIAGGIENLQWLFSGTFIAMLAVIPLFGWLTSRFERKRFLPYVYLFFIFNLLIFFLLFKSDLAHTYIARAFFIWTSVFNLFVVSVFWSFMVDLYSNAQAKRLFAFIAAGGTTGAIIGPIITASLAKPLGATNLLIISIGFLALAVLCIKRLIIWQDSQINPVETRSRPMKQDSHQPMGGSVLAGIRLVATSPYLIGICALILLLTTLATFLYFQQAQIIKDNFVDSSERTAMFAMIDLAVNSLTFMFQIFFTARIIQWIGLAWTLALIPIGLAFGFMSLSFSPIIAVLVVVQVVRRAGNYAIMKPAREMLYIGLNKEEKYKAKNFIDTAVYRGGDAVSAWIYAGMRAMGLSLSNIALIAVPIAGVWAGIAYGLGRRQARTITMQQEGNETANIGEYDER